MPAINQKGNVRKEKLKDVVGDSKWSVNNYLDEKYPPRRSNDIVKKACSLVDTDLDYNLFSYNCEHFATEMRNGKAVSLQVVKKVVKVGKTAYEALINSASHTEPNNS